MTGGGIKLLVIGASGLVGSELTRRARARGLDVIGAARSPSGEATLRLDLADRRAVDEVLAAVSPDVVAICSAWPWVDGCEKDPERSWKENVLTVQHVIDATSQRRRRLIFFSTDHVFNGTRARFFEDDPVGPLNVYARHKREVEERLIARGASLIVRTGWVFGVESRRKNFLYQVVNAALTGRPLVVPAGQTGCPTWSGWLAEASLDLLNEHGIAHLSGDEPLTKAEWATRIIEVLQLPRIEIREGSCADAGQLAPRPERVVLGSRRSRRPPPSLSDVLAELRSYVLKEL